MLTMPLHGIIFVELRHAHAGAAYCRQINIDLLPPGLASAIIFKPHIAMPGYGIERGCCNGAGGKLKTKHCIHGVVDEGP